MSVLQRVGLVVFALALISGCASSQQKIRREQRERAMATAKLYCEFMNGEEYPDIDVALNLSMAQKCDSEKNFSITAYKTPSEIPGVMYCCSVNAKVGTSKLEQPPGKAAVEKAPAKSGEKPKAVALPPRPTEEAKPVETTDVVE